jgi:hypothetical protein
MVKRKRMGAAEAALRGAISGTLAGAAMLVAEHIGEATNLSRGPTTDRRWASRFGQGRKRRRRVVVGWATQLAYSAVLGAAYGVVRNRGKLSRPAEGLVASALAYAAWLPNRKSAPTRGPRLRKLAAQQSPALYSRALVSGFEAIARR